MPLFCLVLSATIVLPAYLQVLTSQIIYSHHERAFRIAKSKIEIRPMFHFTRKRIEAHICICFVALKVYKELERMLKVSEIKMSVDEMLNRLSRQRTVVEVYRGV